MLSEPGPGRSSINIHDHHLFVPLGEGVDETRVKSGYLVFFLFFCPVCGILFLGFSHPLPLTSAIPITLSRFESLNFLCESGAEKCNAQCVTSTWGSHMATENSTLN
jgi:hypothetical protein